MTIYRIHIRPKGGEDNSKKSFSYCLNEQVLGLGWQIDTPPLNWEQYILDATKIYGEKELSRVKYLKNNVIVNDLIWTRDTEGNYYLGKVESPWEYHTNELAKKADIVNVIRCNIIRVPSIDDVPGKVIACFRPARTIQAIRDTTVSDYSKYLWNKLSNSNTYHIPEEQIKNVFSFLGSEETEDIIFIYLQMLDWVVIPNSRKADTMAYEFYLIHKKTKEKAIVQVKTGYTSLTPKDWNDRKEKVFLFQANNQYKGKSDNNRVIIINPEEIKKFMLNNRTLLPANIVHWLDIAKK